MLIKKEVLDKVEFWSEDYFIYMEDVDFCYRIKKEGYKIICLKSAKIYHYTSPNPILRKYCWLRLYRSIEIIKSYIKPDMQILDAGCGAGYLLELLNKNFKNIFLVGIDYNKNIVKLSQKPFYLIIQGDLRSLPLKENSVV